jgi:hypothetical protein
MDPAKEPAEEKRPEPERERADKAAVAVEDSRSAEERRRDAYRLG